MIYTAALSFHKDVHEDLSKIKANELTDVHAQILALIRQMIADQKLVERLLDHGFGDDRKADFSVNKWLNTWKQGKDLWRLKWWDLEEQHIQYRFVYVYLVKEARFVVMAIVKRKDFDYDNPDDPTRKRIFASLQRTYGL